MRIEKAIKKHLNDSCYVSPYQCKTGRTGPVAMNTLRPFGDNRVGISPFLNRMSLCLCIVLQYLDNGPYTCLTKLLSTNKDAPPPL